MTKPDLVRIGFGTAAIGRRSYINIKSDNSVFTNLPDFKNKGIELLNFAADSGIKHFDTSPGYGIAEEMLLNFLNNENRDNIIVSTKWGYTYAANFESDPEKHEIKEHSLNKLNEQWEKSKLLIPNLSLYQIHSVTPDSGVLENYEVLNRLFEIKKEHNIEIGITVSGPRQIELVEKALEITVNEESLFTSFQITYNILDQSLLRIEEKLNNRKIIIKEALANGRMLKNNNYPHYKDMYDEMELIAGKYNAGTDAVALRFCIDSVPGSLVLSGAGTKEQLEQNIKAADFKLSNGEIEKLKEFGVATAHYWDERKELKWI